MDAKMINPFVDAVATVLPQLGFQSVQRGQIRLGEEFVEGRGVTVLIGLTQDVQGNLAYNFTEEAAKGIASTMMMGMPVTQMDEMAQSAISELVNMITANAATHFSSQNLLVDISPPSLVVGEALKARISNGKFLVVEVNADSFSFELNIGIASSK
jgi:chemotaxis protein CheX